MNDLPLCFQKNNGKVVPLPNNFKKAVETIDSLIFDGEVKGKLCTLRGPVTPHLEVGGLSNLPNFRHHARQWLSKYLLPQ